MRRLFHPSLSNHPFPLHLLALLKRGLLFDICLMKEMMEWGWTTGARGGSNSA